MLVMGLEGVVSETSPLYCADVKGRGSTRAASEQSTRDASNFLIKFIPIHTEKTFRKEKKRRRYNLIILIQAFLTDRLILFLLKTQPRYLLCRCTQSIMLSKHCNSLGGGRHDAGAPLSPPSRLPAHPSMTFEIRALPVLQCVHKWRLR